MEKKIRNKNILLTSQVTVRHFYFKQHCAWPEDTAGWTTASICLQCSYGNIKKAKESGRKEPKMAASPGAEEDSVYDAGRLSLFDLILEKTRAQNKVEE